MNDFEDRVRRALRSGVPAVEVEPVPAGWLQPQASARASAARMRRFISAPEPPRV